MTFIDKYVVYTHRVKIYCFIFPFIDFHPKLLKFGRKVLLALFQPLLHPAATVTHGGLLQHLQIALDIAKLLCEYLYHRFLRLRYLGKLVVCQNNTVPIIVFYLGKHLFAVCRGEILLAGIEYLCRWISLAERVGNFVNVGF